MEYFKVFVVTNKKIFKEYCENKLNLDTSQISVENANIEIHLVPYTIPYNLIKMYVTEYIEQEYVVYINSNGMWEELTKMTVNENNIKELLKLNSIMSYEKHKL